MIIKKNHLVYIGENIHFKKYSILDYFGETDSKYYIGACGHYLGEYEKKLFLNQEQYKKYLVKKRLEPNFKQNKSIINKIFKYVCKKIRNS